MRRLLDCTHTSKCNTPKARQIPAIVDQMTVIQLMLEPRLAGAHSFGKGLVRRFTWAWGDTWNSRTLLTSSEPVKDVEGQGEKSKRGQRGFGSGLQMLAHVPKHAEQLIS